LGLRRNSHLHTAAYRLALSPLNKTMSNKAEIFVRFTFAGFHRWEGAPTHRSYLAARHRHLFGVEVKCLVNSDDREIEFHDLLDESKGFFNEPERGNQSCEMLA